jgi:hypothetical protein
MGMTTQVIPGEEIPAGDWTLVPVVARSACSSDCAGWGSVEVLGLLAKREESVVFFSLCEDLKWPDVERMLNQSG